MEERDVAIRQAIARVRRRRRQPFGVAVLRAFPDETLTGRTRGYRERTSARSRTRTAGVIRRRTPLPFHGRAEVRSAARRGFR